MDRCKIARPRGQATGIRWMWEAIILLLKLSLTAMGQGPTYDRIILSQFFLIEMQVID